MFEAIPQDERPELLECLMLYFRCEGNIEQAAQCIHVHKNTFRYRMGKLAQYTGYDLRRPRGRRHTLYCHAIFRCGARLSAQWK